MSNTQTAETDDDDDDEAVGTPTTRTISDDQQLLRFGVCRVPLNNTTFDATKWAHKLSQVTPLILVNQGDGEYAFYRNIMEEPDFPFDLILYNNDTTKSGSNSNSNLSEIGNAILKYFPVETLDELRLDDAFCVHYNMDQDDTTGAKHMDPSDITINICLETTQDIQGSQVLFYGTQSLESVDNMGKADGDDDTADAPEQFLVSQDPGYATVHFGGHPHETTALQRGKRTNIIMTYCYKDKKRSLALTRTCY